MEKEDSLDVEDFLASPRHSYWFLTSAYETLKILHRTAEMMMLASKKNNAKLVIRTPDQGIIISINDVENVGKFVELHDGNATTVAWVLYRRMLGESTLWKDFRDSCDPPPKAILYNRFKEGKVIWHPYVPFQVQSAHLLVPGPIDEKGNPTRLALTKTAIGATPVYFNNLEYFGGVDKSETVGTIADKLERVKEVRFFLDRLRKDFGAAARRPKYACTGEK
jgi:hypothetical protein